jgi:prophage antirepressor-like protein
MQEIQLFQNPQFGEIRTVIKDGEPWFVAKDIAERLGYVWNGIQRISHIPEEWRGVTSVVTPFGNQEMSVISEQGLYFFLNRSDKPSALPFQKWIAGEIIPSIRKHGAYMTPDTIEKALTNPDFIIQLATKLKEEQQKRIEAEQARNRLIHHGKTYTASEIAKELGLKSAIQLNQILEQKKIQYKQNGTWLLFSEYSDKNYTRTKQEVLENGRIIYDRRWTGTGRDFLLELLG